jgi:hypothetical protein
MSFQNSVNQLIGSASYYASINPGLREAQAERKTTERIQRNAAKAQEAVQEVQYKQRSEQRNLRENADNLYDFVSDLGGAANQYNMAARLHNVGEQAHNMQVGAAEAAFAQNPSVKGINDILAARQARSEFDKKYRQQFEQGREFLQFWKDLEEGTGKQYELYDVIEMEKGGKK